MCLLGEPPLIYLWPLLCQRVFGGTWWFVDPLVIRFVFYIVPLEHTHFHLYILTGEYFLISIALLVHFSHGPISTYFSYPAATLAWVAFP